MNVFIQSKAIINTALHALLISSTLIGFPAHAKVKIAHQQRAAKRVVEDYFLALNENDANALTSLFHEQGIEMADNEHELQGSESIQLNFQQLLEQINHRATLRQSFISINGNIAIVEAESDMTLKVLASGLEIPSTDRDLFILKKIDAQWKIDKHVSNGNTAYLDETVA